MDEGAVPEGEDLRDRQTIEAQRHREETRMRAEAALSGVYDQAHVGRIFSVSYLGVSVSLWFFHSSSCLNIEAMLSYNRAGAETTG